MAQRKNRLCAILMFAFLLAGITAQAQKTYFVYLQSDNQQPFFVNINGRNISSSAAGYVILSKLHDSTYPIRIGFPSGGSLQEFELAVNGNDQGFLVKDFGEKGYGLFNMQSLAVLMNSNGSAKQKEAEALKKAADDKRIADSAAAAAIQLAAKQKEDSIALAAAQEKADSAKAALATIPEQPQKDTVATGVTGTAPADTVAKPVAAATPAIAMDEKKDSAAVIKKDTITITTVADSGKPASPAVTITPKSDSTLTASNKTLVEDRPLTVTDSIKSSTPALIKPVADTTVKIDTAGKPSAAAGVAVIKDAAPPKPAGSSPRFLDMEMRSDSAELVPVKPVADSVRTKPVSDTVATIKSPAPPVVISETKGSITSNNSNTTVVTAPAAATVESKKADVYANQPSGNNCKKLASEKDFFSLRKKMAATEDVGEMILTAKTAFREKCYSNDQLRNLCVLFLDDASRYRFLDEAYAYSADPQAYKQLADLLKDEYYLRRFTSMLR